jgi:hypothetical protein
MFLNRPFTYGRKFDKFAHVICEYHKTLPLGLPLERFNCPCKTLILYVKIPRHCRSKECMHMPK